MTFSMQIDRSGWTILCCERSIEFTYYTTHQVTSHCSLLDAYRSQTSGTNAHPCTLLQQFNPTNTHTHTSPLPNTLQPSIFTHPSRQYRKHKHTHRLERWFGSSATSTVRVTANQTTPTGQSGVAPFRRHRCGQDPLPETTQSPTKTASNAVSSTTASA